MNTKATTPTIIVMYLLAVVVGALVLLYGFRSVSSLIERGDKALLIKFQSNFENDLDEISNLPGTVRILDYSIPSKFETICIYEFGRPCSLSGQFQSSEEIVCDSVNSEAANIFLLPLQENDIKISNIKLTENPLCFNLASSMFKVKITGQGKSVLLEKVS